RLLLGASLSDNNATLSLKQLSIVNTNGSAIVAVGGGINSHGIVASGASGGSGMALVSGPNGAGGLVASGVGTASGIRATAATTGHGLSLSGGETSGYAVTGTVASGEKTDLGLA